jgi:hypothetical protein
MRDWQFSMPEPHETDGYIDRATGPRREMSICYTCGWPTQRADAYCSDECAEQARQRVLMLQRSAKDVQR